MRVPGVWLEGANVNTVLLRGGRRVINMTGSEAKWRL